MNDSSMQYDRQHAIKMLAEKLTALPDSMAWVIAKYREIEQIDDAAIARRLGTDIDGLNHLALCGRPREDLFMEDIEAIAEHLSIELRPFLELVRHVETIEAFRYHSAAGSTRLLAAARDIAEEPATPYQAGEEEPEEEARDEPEKDQP
jgi:hypothetical protein